MHQGGVRTFVRAMLISIATAGFLTWGFYVSAATPNGLVISKIQITGGTGKTGEDFVSIYNGSAAPIDLNGLRLVKRTKSGTSDTILKSWTTSTLVSPGAYHVWANSDFAATIHADSSSSQTISNDNAVALRQSSGGEIIDSVGWGEAANIFVETEPFPLNPEGGQYIERIDNIDTNNNSLDFQIYPPEQEPTAETENTSTQSSTLQGSTKDLLINELFVNPKEIDSLALEPEFIELYNSGNGQINFDDWRIEIGEIVFELPRGTVIGPKGFISLRSPKNISLPNGGASIKLFSPGRTTANQTVTYKQAPDGFAYANFSGAWRWTAVATPDKPNVLAQAPSADFEILGPLLPNSLLRFDSSDSFTNAQATQYSWSFGNGETSVVQNPDYSFAKEGDYTISLTVTTEYGSSKIDKKITIGNTKVEKETVRTTAPSSAKAPEGKPLESENDIFTTAGTVVVAPGIFGVQYFYLLPEYGEPLIEVYNSKKLFPKLKIGDQVIVTGDYSEREQGPRLKTTEAKDIQVIGQGEVENPKPITSSEIKKPPYPRMATVEGEVVSKKSPRVFLADAEGEIEIYLSKNTGIKIGDFIVGDKLSISGILLISNGVARLQPRDKEDIEKITELETELANTDFEIASLPISHTTLPESFNAPERFSDKTKLFMYLGGGMLVLIGGILYLAYTKK